MGRIGDKMIKKNVKITSNEGLHARPATEISKIANKFRAFLSDFSFDNITQ